MTNKDIVFEAVARAGLELPKNDGSRAIEFLSGLSESGREHFLRLWGDEQVDQSGYMGSFENGGPSDIINEMLHGDITNDQYELLARAFPQLLERAQLLGHFGEDELEEMDDDEVVVRNSENLLYDLLMLSWDERFSGQVRVVMRESGAGLSLMRLESPDQDTHYDRVHEPIDHETARYLDRLPVINAFKRR